MAPKKKEGVTAHISLNGGDRTGVVARVTQYLFEQGANIEALEELVTRGQFHMSLTCSWKEGEVDEAQRKALKRDLSRIGREVEMETRVRFQEPHKKQRMAVLVTKESHCLEAILAAWAKGELKAEPVVVLSNRRDLKEIVEDLGLPFKYIPWTDPKRAEARLLAQLDAFDVDFMVLARFMKILSPELCWRYRNKIINIHPSLLPAFPGARAYAQAYEKGVRIVGVTAHFVTPDLDQGPIIMQDAFRVRPDEELDVIKERGQAKEAEVLLEAIDLYLAKRLDVHWGRVWTT